KVGSARDANYVYWLVEHLTDTDVDVWTTTGTFEAIRTGPNAFVDGRRIVSNGNNEIAIRETGKPDHMGGRAHRDEIASATAAILLDGVRFDLPIASGTYKCRKV